MEYDTCKSCRRKTAWHDDAVSRDNNAMTLKWLPFASTIFLISWTIQTDREPTKISQSQSISTGKWCKRITYLFIVIKSVVNVFCFKCFCPRSFPEQGSWTGLNIFCSNWYETWMETKNWCAKGKAIYKPVCRIVRKPFAGSGVKS